MESVGACLTAKILCSTPVPQPQLLPLLPSPQLLLPPNTTTTTTRHQPPPPSPPSPPQHHQYYHNLCFMSVFSLHVLFVVMMFCFKRYPRYRCSGARARTLLLETEICLACDNEYTLHRFLLTSNNCLFMNMRWFHPCDESGLQ